MDRKIEKPISINDKILANAEIVFQEEDDNWGILFNPKTDFSFAVNPVSVFIWKQLTGKHTLKELVIQVKNNCTGVSDEVEDDVKHFVEQLLEHEMALLADR